MDKKNFDLSENSSENNILNMLEALRVLAEVGPELAKARKAMFDHYVEAGFTKEQALEIVTKGV